MFVSKVFTVFTGLLALPLLAVATGGHHTTPTTTATSTTTVTVTHTTTSTPTPASQCNTGPIQCCNSVTTASNPAASLLLGLLGIVVQGLNIPIGLGCDPISVIGVGGNSCSATPVCCENNSFKGLIAIGCVPVILNL